MTQQLFAVGSGGLEERCTVTGIMRSIGEVVSEIIVTEKGREVVMLGFLCNLVDLFPK